MNIDLLSISGHKIYAPKGVGALYVRRKPRVRITAMMSGGGQERGMRSGTLSPALCVGYLYPPVSHWAERHKVDCLLALVR